MKTHPAPYNVRQMQMVDNILEKKIKKNQILF
jgi:hypothetical protein